MSEIKEFTNGIDMLKKIRENIENHSETTEAIRSRYIEMLKEASEEILEINELINELNTQLFKLTSKIDGFYLKDITRLGPELIFIKYKDILGQVVAVNRHSEEYPEKKLNKANEKAENIKAKCSEFVGLVNRLDSNIKQLVKVEEKLRSEIDNAELVDKTIIYLSNNIQEWN